MTLAAPVVEVTATGISLGAVFGLLALGLALIYRTTGIMNFAHWAIGILGVVLYALLTGAGLPPFASMLIAVVGSTVAGVIAYRVVFRRVSRANQIIVILIALAIAQFYSSIAALVLRFQTFTRLPPWMPTTDIKLGISTFRTTEVITAGAAVVIAFGFLTWLRVSQTGRALRAVAQNREAAMLVGIDDVKYSSIAWGIGSALAAFSLLLVMPHKAGAQGGLINTIDLTPLGTLLIPAFGAALVGGLINLPMALLGGVIFGLSQELLVLAPKPLSDMRSVVAAVLIVLLLLLRTERFFATRQELEALET